MKRILVLAVLAGAIAAQTTAARAQGGPDGGNAAPSPSAPAQNLPEQGAQPAQNPLANAAPPDANVVQPDQPRGALGGLASGAPGVAQNVQQLGQAAPQAPVIGESSTAVVGSAGSAVVGSTTTVIAAPQPMLSRAQRHWLVGRTLQHCMFFSDAQPHAIRHGRAMPLGFFPGPFVAHPMGDLELLSVGMVCDGLADKGPVYRISLRNNSTFPSRHFRVSLIATLGEITRMSPVVSLNIEELAAGATAHVDVQLPHGVMALGPQGQPGPFSTLIAAIDSFDELIESDELNNVLTLTRGEVALIETTVAAPVVASPEAAPLAAQPGPQSPVQSAPAPQAPAPAPQDNADLDQLDLDNVAGASDLLDR